MPRNHIDTFKRSAKLVKYFNAYRGKNAYPIKVNAIAMPKVRVAHGDCPQK